jgi:hypothetical protein
MDLSFLANQRRDIVVTFVTQFNDGFGYGDDGEQVFIPRSLMDKFMLRAVDVVRCKVVKNDPKFRERCPWRAYHVERLGNQLEMDFGPSYDEMEDVVEATPDPETVILGALEQAEMLSTADVAKLLGTDTNHVRHVLDRLHRERRLVRADIYVNADQTKASRCMWAYGDHIFQPLQQEGQ